MMRRSTLGAILLTIACTLAAGCSGDSLGVAFDAAPEIDARVNQPTLDARGTPDAAPEIDAPSPDATTFDARTFDAAPTLDAATADARTADAGPTGDAGALSCITAPSTTKVVTSSVLYSQTFSGATNQYAFNSNQCSDPPDSIEKIYSFQLSTPTEWYAETRCNGSSSWDCELVLTKDGCSDAEVVSCATTPGDEIISGATLQPGKYALFVEGDNPEDPAVYDLMVNFNHTAGVAQCAATPLSVLDLANCEDPILDSPNYHLVLDNEVTSPEDLDDFFVEGVDGCTHDQDHVGGAPDRVYTLTLPAAHDVTISVESPDWDALLYITGSPCGARSAVVACSDDLTGSTEEISANLGAGTWYIVVDGFGEETFNAASWGAFTLDVKVYDDVCNE